MYSLHEHFSKEPGPRGNPLLYSNASTQRAGARIHQIQNTLYGTPHQLTE